MLVRKIYKEHPENMGIYPDHIPQPDQMTHPDQISKLHEGMKILRLEA